MMMGSSGANGESGFSQGRWPRQETLTLLEIRTRLHPKFQQASAQKAPLWDEVSRMMAEEHGYQRSGKKCKEKLDNLYKYYKKTKVSSSAKRDKYHDGKHYRFFKQLDALYGSETNTCTIASIANEMPLSYSHTHRALLANQEAIQAPRQNISTNSDNSTSSEEEEEDEEEDGFGIRLKIQVLIEAQVRRLMEVQESCMENILGAIERMEQERASRDEARQRQELLRFEQEERLWACERAWIEARDAALINALERIGCRCRHNRSEIKKISEQQQAVADDDDDVIADLIRLQNWVQPELDYDRYRNGLLS